MKIYFGSLKKRKIRVKEFTDTAMEQIRKWTQVTRADKSQFICLLGFKIRENNIK